MIEFLELANNLKRVKRKGWQLCGIRNPESVAEHSYEAALLGLLLSDESLDQLKILKMLLIHDIGESITGDITPHDGVALEEKARNEAAAIRKLASLDKNTELIGLFKEFTEQKTPEARFARQVDVLEMAFQAYAYEKQNPKLRKHPLWTFWEYADERIKDKKLRRLFNELLIIRKL